MFGDRRRPQRTIVRTHLHGAWYRTFECGHPRCIDTGAALFPYGAFATLMLFAPGAPREAYFEGFAHLADMTDEERREWFIENDNYFVES